jgi:O-antigen/teichoic acid export membrane protein
VGRVSAVVGPHPPCWNRLPARRELQSFWRASIDAASNLRLPLSQSNEYKLALPMTTAKSATLTQRAVGAGKWSVVGQALSQLIRLGANLVMTRLLVPEMFGIAAIAAMVPVILALLSDFGLSQNIVQSRRGDDPAFLDTAWVVQIARGGVLWLAALALSVALYLANLGDLFPAGSVYASPELPSVIAVSSFSAFIAGFASTRMATALRRFEQKRYIQIELVSQLAGIIVMIAIGVAAHSVWALVAAGLVGSLMTTILSHVWMGGHPNRFRWEKSALHELVGFGKWIFVSSAVYVLAMNGDRLLLGGFVDARMLGLYVIAALMIGAIEGAFGRLLSVVSLPVFSEIARNDPSRLREAYYKLRVPSDLVLLFLTGLLYASGHLVIDLLYDSRYAAAGGMLQILALSLVVVRYGIAHQLYLALGLPRNLAIINAARLIFLYASVPALYYLAGLQAAIWAVALHALPTVLMVFLFNAKLGLNDFRREAIVLIALPAGYLCGFALNLLSG